MSGVAKHIADARALGVALLPDGARHALGGSFFEPTVFTDVTQAMSVARREFFAPSVPLIRFNTGVEASVMANDIKHVRMAGP